MKTIKHIIATLKFWERKKDAARSHESQPVVEFHFEQAAIAIFTVIALRAHDRGDTRTFNRLKDVAEAGAAALRRDEVA